MAKKKDRRSKKDFRLLKLKLVKEGKCRQCGRKREKTSPSTIRCLACAKTHARYMNDRRHRPATASKKGRAKVQAREQSARVRRPLPIDQKERSRQLRRARDARYRAKRKLTRRLPADVLDGVALIQR
jgi:hypothetical protein